MSEKALYQPKRGNPTALTIVILLHGAAIAALAMHKMEVIGPEKFVIPDVFDVYTPPPPPPEPVEQVKVELPRTPPVYVPPRVIDTPVDETRVTTTVERPVYYPPVDRGPVIQVEPSPPPPPPPPARKLEPARAKANLASYVSDADYPASAIRSEQQGTTRFTLSVGADGRVKECSVVGSSGSSALDSATCRLMKSRARFTPARNSDGQPTGDTVTAGIKWVLPDY
jgi:protein TonB